MSSNNRRFPKQSYSLDKAGPGWGCLLIVMLLSILAGLTNYCLKQ